MAAGVYYNDNDPYAAQWLRNLIAAGHLPAGDVDERSITEVRADELTGYTQHHFFAGIGGWPLALQWAGWPADEPVWTGSCPCQPLSGAGRRRGADDERHLWPAFHALIAECRPPVVFGEQVSGTLGRDWLSAVRADLEHGGYAVGSADLSAAGVGAPHIRQRLYWVADATGGNGHRLWPARRGWHESSNGGTAERMANPDGGEADATTARRLHAESVESRRGTDGGGRGWQSIEWIPCADGKERPIEPGLHPLVNGIPNRVGRLRAYGNAIVPQVAQAFIEAYMEVRS